MTGTARSAERGRDPSGRRHPAARQGRHRPLAVRLDRAARAVQAGGPRRHERPARGGDLLEPRRRASLQGDGLAHRRRRRALGRGPRRPAEHDRRRVRRVRRGAAQGPARDRGARRTRDHRHGPGPDRHLGLRRAPGSGAASRRPGGLGRRLAPQGARLEPVREPGHGPALRRRPQPDGAARGRGHAPRRRAGHHGRVRPSPRARPAAARRRQAARHPPARGPSFTLDGNAVQWQKWSLRVGFNHREGMVLHTVAYDGRSVAHRLSFAEMVVPYRDPTTDHYRRTRSTSASGASGS